MRLHLNTICLFILLSTMALTACGGPSATPIVSSTPITPGSQPESAQPQEFTQLPEPTSTPQSVAIFRPTLASSPTLATIVVPASSPTTVTKTTPVPTATPALVANAPTQKPVTPPSPMPSRLEMMWNQRVEEAFAPSDCPAVTTLELEGPDYKGPLIRHSFPHVPFVGRSVRGGCGRWQLRKKMCLRVTSPWTCRFWGRTSR